MSLRTLKWLTVVLPMAFLAAFDYFRHQVFFSTLHTAPGFLGFLIFTFVAILLFAHAVFGLIAKMERRIVRQNQELGAVAEVAAALGQSLQLDDVMQVALDKAAALLDADAGVLCVLDEAHDELVATARRGISDELFAQIRRAKVDEHAVGAVVIRTGEPVAVGDAFADPRIAEVAGREGLRSILAIPLKTKGHPVGVLALARRRHQPFSPADVTLLATIAGQVGMAIQNASLHAQVQHLAVVEERGRIARELHDGVAQVLGYVQNKSAAARRLLQQGEPAVADAQLLQLEQAAREAYTDAREVIFGLRAILRPGRGLAAVLQEYLDHFGPQAGLVVELRMVPAVEDVPLAPQAEHHVLRIVQEALANVRKHAEARHAWVSFEDDEQHLQIVIDDDGKGFDASSHRVDAQPRFGLHMMRERAAAVGGSLDVLGRPGGGSRVIVRVPRNGKQGGNGG